MTSVDSDWPNDPRPGLYRHYKGADYRVLACVGHSETDERMVLYRALYGERGLWVRPLALFVSTLEIDGRRVPRFAFVRALPGLHDNVDQDSENLNSTGRNGT